MAKNNAVITTTLLYCCWWHLVLIDSYFELSSLSSMKADHWKKMEIVLYFVSIKIRCCLWVQYFFNTLSDILLSWISLKYCDINFWPPQTHGQIIISKICGLWRRGIIFCLHTLTQADSCVPVNMEEVLANVFCGSLRFCLCLHCLCIVPYLSMC